MAKQLTLLENNHAPIKEVEFHEVFSANYGLYGLHVVQERALPDARDGLKPVQRRILYTLYEGRYFSSGPHRKSAEIVGKVLGDRHPHGDGSVYDAMVRMAQPFSLRYPLVDGQGNWGASDGSPAAAYRYTEAKLTPLAEALLSDDIKKETVPLIMTYKGEPNVLEPLYLPGHIPPCVNPIEGIAVGISTGVPPHNLKEAIAVSIAMLDAGVLDGKKFSTEQLMRYLPGPDFPEGGRIMAAAGGLREYLENGKGKFIVRGEVAVEQITPQRRQLVISALPPIGRDKVVASIIDAINERKLEGIVPEPPLDETNEVRTRIVLELKRDAKPEQVLQSLWQHTLLQISVGVQLYYLFSDTPFTEAKRPRQVGMVELLTYWLHHQLEVLERRLRFELRQYKTRLATVEALIIGAKSAQPIVKIFQDAENRPAAKAAIQQKYKLTEEQAEVIASMSLSQVTRLDAGKYETEKKELLEKIAAHEALLASRPERINLLKRELKETGRKFGDERRTMIDSSDLKQTGTIAAAPVVARDPLALAIYQDSTLKATPLSAFAPGKATTKSDEGLTELIAVQPGAFVLAASNKGRVFGVQTEKLDVSTRGGRGESVARHLKLEPGEKIQSLLAVPSSAFDAEETELYLVEFSALGKVKKTPIAEYKTASSTGITSLKLAAGDEVITAILSAGKSDYLVTSDNGQTLRFPDDKLSAQGRVGQGQAAIALSNGAKVVGAQGVSSSSNAGYLLVITAQNLVKKTPLDEYPVKGRATAGVATLLLTDKDTIVASAFVKDGTNALIVSEAGNVIMDVNRLVAASRNRKGQPLEWSGLSGVPRLVNLNLEQ